MIRKPVAVITGDVHFTVGTLELATSSVRQAQDLAAKLEVPLILNGDTLDAKAVIRAECANRLISLLTDESRPLPRTIVNTGNHDLCNEKGKEHSLHFLAPYCEVVDQPTFDGDLDAWIIPYQNTAEGMQETLNRIKAHGGSRLIVHQGVMSAYMGAYVQDKTSLPKETYADFRTIASHYHRRQDIKCGRPRKGAVGLFSYCGSPYSLSFAEAGDGDKGINILYADGILELVPTNLRKHLIADITYDELIDGCGESFTQHVRAGDLVWLKIRGAYSELEKINKRELGMRLFGHAQYKLEKIPSGADIKVARSEQLTGAQLFDRIIDQTAESAEQKQNLKSLWREVAGEAA